MKSEFSNAAATLFDNGQWSIFS